MCGRTGFCRAFKNSGAGGLNGYGTSGTGEGDGRRGERPNARGYLARSLREIRGYRTALEGVSELAGGVYPKMSAAVRARTGGAGIRNPACGETQGLCASFGRRRWRAEKNNPRPGIFFACAETAARKRGRRFPPFLRERESFPIRKGVGAKIPIPNAGRAGAATRRGILSRTRPAGNGSSGST